ncbi:MAG TPA: hypothetical protein VK631_19785, partial [Solirubrobacteraceae bacterium]|nr:hypothetical protein [Solirubrobacteraceae bacterium]
DGADRTRAVRNLAGARRSWAEGDRGQALARLARSTAAASEADVVQADVVEDVLLRLARLLGLAKLCER